MDGGAWWAIVHGITKNWTRLSDSVLSTGVKQTQSREIMLKTAIVHLDSWPHILPYFRNTI